VDSRAGRVLGKTPRDRKNWSSDKREPPSAFGPVLNALPDIIIISPGRNNAGRPEALTFRDQSGSLISEDRNAGQFAGKNVRS